MKINKFKFGSITIDGRMYDHDVLIYPDGHIEEREGSRGMFGSHDIREEEIEQICKDRPDLVIVGTGMDGKASLSFDGEAWSKDKGIELIVSPSEEAVEKLNKTRDRKIAALIHVTC